MMAIGLILLFQRRADKFLSLTIAVGIFCCLLVVPDIVRMAIAWGWEKQQDLCNLSSHSSIIVATLYCFHVLNTLLNFVVFFVFCRKFKVQCFRELTSWGCGKFFAISDEATVRPAPSGFDVVGEADGTSVL